VESVCLAGRTPRAATDAEIILLRAVEEDRKVAIVKRWIDEGKTTVVFRQMPAAGPDFARTPRTEQAKLLEVNENWIVLSLGGVPRAFLFPEFNVGYDPLQNLPQIRYHGGIGT
jgi:hypothetical protein